MYKWFMLGRNDYKKSSIGVILMADVILHVEIGNCYFHTKNAIEYKVSTVVTANMLVVARSLQLDS